MSPPPCTSAPAQSVALPAAAVANVHQALRAWLQSDLTLMITNAAGIVQYVNAAYEARSGYAAAELVGRPLGRNEAFPHCAELDAAFFARYAARAASGESLRGIFAKRGKNGEIYHEEQLLMPVNDGATRLAYYVLSGRPPASAPRAPQATPSPATHDLLTGVANRRWLIDRLWRTIARSRRQPQCFALLHVDIDRFRRINETHGHRVGDQLLAAVARRIVQTSAHHDVVARLGDDGFAVIAGDVRQEADARQLAETLIGNCAAPFVIGGRSLRVRISVGIARFPDDGQSAEALLQNAEVALYQAKSSRPGSCIAYNGAQESTRHADLALEQALGGALDNGEFTLRFQPIVCTTERRSVALEALLGWKSPLHGEVPRERFIPLLDRTGLSDAVGRWTLHTACAQFKALRDRPGAPATLCVNLAARRLHSTTLIGELQAVLQASDLGAQQLELEISENALVEDASAAAGALRRLRALGVRLAIDDFGTGYSSLSHLRRFPIDTLKIDRSFISQIATHQDALVITRAIVNLAAGLGIDAVAVGVDHAAQLERLSELGCTRAQGLLFCPPLAIDEVRRRLDCGNGVPCAS